MDIFFLLTDQLSDKLNLPKMGTVIEDDKFAIISGFSKKSIEEVARIVDYEIRDFPYLGGPIMFNRIPLGKTAYKGLEGNYKVRSYLYDPSEPLPPEDTEYDEDCPEWEESLIDHLITVNCCYFEVDCGIFFHIEARYNA